MKISEIMTTDVKQVCATDSAEQAASFMLSADTGSIPVTDGDKLIGMITDRDIAVRGVAKGYGPDTKVSELMTSDVISANIDDDVEQVATMMSNAQVRRLPVVDSDSCLRGMVSLGDLSREATTTIASEALEGVSQPGSQHSQ